MLSETQGIIDNTSDYPSGGYPQGIVVPGIDVLLARRAVDDAHDYLGHWVIVRNRIKPEEGIERCPDCYDEVYGQSTNMACTTCYGTTFVGGYHEPILAKAIFRRFQEDLQLKRDGIARLLVPEVTMPYEPAVWEWDLIVRVTYSGGEITGEKDRYWIKEVEYMELAPDYEKIGQRFSITKIQYEDPGNNIPIT